MTNSDDNNRIKRNRYNTAIKQKRRKKYRNKEYEQRRMERLMRKKVDADIGEFKAD